MKGGNAGEQKWPEQWQNGKDECDLLGSLIVTSSASWKGYWAKCIDMQNVSQPMGPLELFLEDYFK